MDQNPDVQEDLGTGGKFKNWLQDNIRIILSVLIVLAIAGGIYSYSQRAEGPTDEEIAMEEGQEQVIEEEEGDSVTIIGEDEQPQQEEKKEEEPKQEAQKEQPKEEPKQAEQPQQQPQQQQPQQEEKKDDVRVDDQGDQAATSEETGEAFVETAVQSDSKTTLARKAVRDYLEKNNDSSLTAEHKIYIEDLLQKQSQHSSKVKVGDKISFSKTMIKDAIEKSKTLNENQLNNLKKYSARVSNL